MDDGQVQQGLIDAVAERALLSVSILESSSWAQATDVVEPSDFTSEGRQLIWKAISQVYTSGGTPDEALIRSKVGDSCGPEIDQVLASSGKASNTSSFAERVRRLSELRAIQTTCRRLDAAIDGSADPDHLASQAMERMLSAVTRSTSSRQTIQYGDLMTGYVADLERERVARESGKMVGALFDFPPVDDYTFGLRWDDGDTVILAGDPGAGKTAVSMFLLRRFAMVQAMEKDPVGAGMLSMEMGRYATAMRWSQMVGQLSSSKLRGGMDAVEISQLRDNVNRETGLPLWINFAEDCYADQIKAIIANGVQKHNIRLWVLDHMRMFNMRSKHHDQNALDEARAKYIKDMAKSLGVTIIVIAHSTKAAANREDKTPQMDDLRGSRQISAAVDQIGFIYRPWMTATREEKANAVYQEHEAYFVWAKNRFNALAKPRFEFHGDTMRIEEPKTWGAPPVKRIHVPETASYEQSEMLGPDAW